MLVKEKLRKRFLYIRKNKYFEINKNFFTPLIKLISLKYKKKNFVLSSYFPASYEVDVLKIYETNFIKKKILYPKVKKNNDMNFYKWDKNSVLQINKFGILEPIDTKKSIIPDIMLVPLLAFDKFNNRLGYGKGYYDNYLNKYLKIKKNILRIGIAFSFQKYKKLPSHKNDVKLNYILTEKGLSK